MWRLVEKSMSTIEKNINTTSVLDSCTAVSKRAVFGNFRDVGGVGALGVVRRHLAFMRESKILLGKMVCSSFK
jgi:hypothetical protein